MQPFLSFYNSLDVLNKIMFFGIIIVIILTIITLIIYSKKSKIKTIKPKEKTEDVLEELPIIMANIGNPVPTTITGYLM